VWRIRAYFNSVLSKWWYSAPLLPPVAGALSLPTRAVNEIIQRLAGLNVVEVPALVVGVSGLVVGGAGKTPFTIWLAGELADVGVKTVVVHGGYGRRVSVLARVVDTEDYEGAFRVFGDEAVLIYRRLNSTGPERVPVWVGPKWMAAAMACGVDRPDVVIVDDAGQHRRLKKNMEIMVFNLESPWGNGSLVPFGPLREPLSAVGRARFAVCTGIDSFRFPETVCVLKRFLHDDVSVVLARKRPAQFVMGDTFYPASFLEDRKVVAFAGTARPEGFFRLLKLCGAVLKGVVSFPDHYPYSGRDMAVLTKRAEQSGADLLVCTEKDYCRVPVSWQNKVGYVTIDLDFGEWNSDVRKNLIDAIVSRVKK